LKVIIGQVLLFQVTILYLQHFKDLQNFAYSQMLYGCTLVHRH